MCLLLAFYARKALIVFLTLAKVHRLGNYRLQNNLAIGACKKKVNCHFSSNFYLFNVLCVGVIWACLLVASIAQPSRAAAL